MKQFKNTPKVLTSGWTLYHKLNNQFKNTNNIQIEILLELCFKLLTDNDKLKSHKNDLHDKLQQFINENGSLYLQLANLSEKYFRLKIKWKNQENSNILIGYINNIPIFSIEDISNKHFPNTDFQLLDNNLNELYVGSLEEILGRF